MAKRKTKSTKQNKISMRSKLLLAVSALKWIANQPKTPYSFHKAYSKAQLKAQETVEILEPEWKASPPDFPAHEEGR